MGQAWACVTLILALLPKASTHCADPQPVVNSLGMRLVLIRSGEYEIGSPLAEPGRRDDEPRRRVTLSRGYLLGQHETTRGQFRRFVEQTGYRTDCERDGAGGWGFDEGSGRLSGPDPRYSWRFTGFSQTDEHPVVNVSWNDAVAFCDWLSQEEGERYRLPTEAEWESACRAGAASAFHFGSEPELLARHANTADAGLKGRFPERNSIAAADGHVFTAPVGSYPPNHWGLCDMTGNVWEWTSDWYERSPSAELQVDPSGPAVGVDRVIKGGDWFHDDTFARSASRYPMAPHVCRRHAGFRVMRDLAQH